MTQEYEVLPVEKLLELLDSNEIISEEQIEYNKAFVEKLQDGRILVTPNIGNQGVLFYSDEAYLTMLKQQYFPVKEDGSIFESEREKIQRIADNVLYFVNILSSKLNLKVELKTDIENLDAISVKIREYAHMKNVDDIQLPLWILTCELLRLKVNGVWDLEKVYTLNPYWKPYITDKEKHTFLLGKFFSKQLEDINTFSLREILEKASKPVQYDDGE